MPTMSIHYWKLTWLILLEVVLCILLVYGMTALIATLILGPRTGRFYDLKGKLLDETKPFPGHSLALQCLGVSMCILLPHMSMIYIIR